MVQRYLEMGQYDFAVALLSGMFDRPGTENSFISFNYDLVIEEAFRKLGLAPDYGTASLKWNGGPPNGKSIPLLKLHGSINWTDLHADSSSLTPFVYGKYGDFGTSHSPILVARTWNKGNFHAVIKDVWAKAYDELVSATRIVVIGYSMPVTDTHFSYLVATALANNPGLYNAGLVDLDSPQLIERYTGLFGPLLQCGKFEFLGGANGLQEFRF